HFSHLHFIVRRSFLHRNFMAEGFPQAPVRLWVMLSAYAADSERRGIRAGRGRAMDVPPSLDALRKQRARQLAIHSKNGDREFIISSEHLQAIRQEVVAYLASKP